MTEIIPTFGPPTAEPARLGRIGVADPAHALRFISQNRVTDWKLVGSFMKTHCIALAAIALFSSAAPVTTWGQEPTDAKATAGVERVDSSATAVPRFDSQVSASSVQNSRMSTAELRQARALYRAQQRVARLEYNLWMGREPLRPNWNSVPMMSSRYTSQRVYVPVYVYTR